MKFFLKIMEVLRQQSGASFFEDSIKGFLNLFSTQNLITDLLKETESSSIMVEKCVFNSYSVRGVFLCSFLN